MIHYDKVVYVAGPFRAPNNFLIQCNIERARDMALDVWKAGFSCLCPHLNTGLAFQGVLPDEAWLDGDLAMLRRCDAVVMTPYWESSSGAKAERDLAKSLGIPVFEDVFEMQNHFELEAERASEPDKESSN